MNIILSLIIPVYNSQKYLAKLFKSINEQNLDELEVIFVDDGSTDNSLSLLKDFESKNINVKVIHQQNQGGSIARNTGLSIAKGKYVYFFDSDDSLNSYILKDLIILLEETNADILIGNVKTINEKGLIKNKNPIFNNELSIDSHKLFFYDSNPGNKIFKTEIIMKYNVKFGDVRIVQDLNFYLKYILFCKSVCYTDIYMYYYLIRENSISNTYSMYITDVVKSLNDVKKFYIKMNKANKYKDELEYNLVKHLVFQFNKIQHIKKLQERIIVVRYFTHILKSVNIYNNKYLTAQIKKEIEEFLGNKIAHIIKF